MEILHQFIKECVKEYNRTKHSELQDLHYFNYYKSDDKIALYEDYIFQSNKRMDNIFFEQKEELLKYIDYFRDNKKWYADKGIPHTLGLLFYGVPGCGKTSTIKAIANYLERHIVNIPLSKIEYADELRNIFYCPEIEDYDITNDKRIYVFEDIDCLSDIIKKRDNIDVKPAEIKKEDDKKDEIIEALVEHANHKRYKPKRSSKSENKEPLTLSFILNLFDGVLEQNGRIIILTTNHIDNIDPALIRTGRIDYKIEFKKASNQIIKQILSHFYDIPIGILEKYHFDEYKHSISDIMNICQIHKFNMDKAIELL
jgi:SpoVK/Ycf46/Vps4 family AAA+-type ATPase